MLCVRPGDGPLAWLATGSMVKTALEAARDWPCSAVWSVPSVKPLDAQHVAAACARHEAVVVLEEHSVHGGLGAAVAEAAAAHAPAWVCRVGVRDRFSRYCGSYDYLMREHGLDVVSVRAQVREFLETIPGRSARPLAA
jgi:transketolase